MGLKTTTTQSFALSVEYSSSKQNLLCKNCGQTYEKLMKYCPECGSMMQANSNQRISDFAEELLLTKELDYSHKAIDFGLSVKWADRNIGAPSPMEKGDYFA